MNPMMRRGSQQQWMDLVNDVIKGTWQKLCQSGARLLEDSMKNGGVKVSYLSIFDMMSTFESFVCSHIDSICLALQHRSFY